MSPQGRRPRRRIADRLQGDSEPVSLTTIVLSIVSGGLLALTLGVWCTLELEQLGPPVGGVIVFRPEPTASERWTADAIAIDGASVGLPRNDAVRRCVLRPSVMAHSGGSMVVEARQMGRSPIFRVHWSGGRTENGAADCGPTADLVLTRTELMRLANAAGGLRGG